MMVFYGNNEVASAIDDTEVPLSLNNDNMVSQVDFQGESSLLTSQPQIDRKLIINPITGVLEPHIAEYVPLPSEQREPVNPVSGLLELV